MEAVTGKHASPCTQRCPINKTNQTSWKTQGVLYRRRSNLTAPVARVSLLMLPFLSFRLMKSTPPHLRFFPVPQQVWSLEDSTYIKGGLVPS